MGYICWILLIAEGALLITFILGKLLKKNISNTFVYLAIAYIINLIINLIPDLYETIKQEQYSSIFLYTLKNILSTPAVFVGKIDFPDAIEFGEIVSMYPYVYLLGALIAMLGTVFAAVEALSRRIINVFKLHFRLHNNSCDIVVGTSEQALLYVKNNKDCVLLTNKVVSKEALTKYISLGYVVWNKVLSVKLLQSITSSTTSQYNLICFSEGNDFFSYIDTFVDYQNDEEKNKLNIKLFLEVDEDKLATVRGEIVEKNGYEHLITAFSRNELMARSFVEDYPVTKHLPKEFILEDASIKANTKINVFYLGQTALSEEIFRQYSINNQLVSYKKKEYAVNPINYFFFDESFKTNNYAIKDLLPSLKSLGTDDYVTIPEAPFNVSYPTKPSTLKDEISNILSKLNTKNSYSYIVIDFGDEYKNVELGSRLKALFSEYDNFHIYVCAQEKYSVDEEHLTYYGNFNSVLTHDVIVNEGLAIMGKAVNKMYFKELLIDKKDSPDYLKFVEKEAQISWEKQNYFTLYSNIYSALSLRIKLNLLGLDYVKDGKAENLELIKEKYDSSSFSKEYNSYFEQSKKNALLAQEHARWNAYHLVNEYLPMPKEKIVATANNGEYVKFVTKNTVLRKHACLASFKGLDNLSSYLASKASNILGKEVATDVYDYYKYDEALISSAEDILRELGYSIVKK